MKIRANAHEALSKAKDTLDDVSDASKKVVETTNWATVALVAVAALSLIGLTVGVVALSRSTRAH